MSEKNVVAVFVFVALFALGGLVLTNTTNTTVALASANVVKNCRTVNAAFNNCATPNGGCNPGYPEYKQYTYKIEGIPTCCCVLHQSSQKKKYGYSLYT